MIPDGVTATVQLLRDAVAIVWIDAPKFEGARRKLHCLPIHKDQLVDPVEPEDNESESDS